MQDFQLDSYNDAIQNTIPTIIANNNPIKICADTCTKNTEGTSFTNQWQHEVEF
jgi:hypothetical protein